MAAASRKSKEVLRRIAQVKCASEKRRKTHSAFRLPVGYHAVFAPKYRGKAIGKTLREDVIAIIKKRCKGIKGEIINGRLAQTTFISW